MRLVDNGGDPTCQTDLALVFIVIGVMDVI